MNLSSSLSRFFRPASVAIVGLSADKTKHGQRVLAFLRKFGFTGPIWGVHPKTPPIDGVDMFPSLSDLPDSPDAVVLAVPPPAIPDILEEAGELKAGGAILFSGGFAETGEEGLALQHRIRDIARAGGVRLLGPNSAGVIHPAAGTVMSFLTCLERPAEQIRSGPVGLVTQSGGTGSYIYNLAAEHGGGLAISISTGNEADIELGEAFEWLVAHPDVKAIALLLEMVRNGPRFVEAARAALAAGKPVVVCKIGRSESGQRIMRTHTAALAGSMQTYDAIFHALGITTTRTPAELYEVAEIMARSPLPSGEGIGIVTHSGGAAVMLADRAEELGLALPESSDTLQRRLAPYLQMGTAGNPADLGGIVGGPERYTEVVRCFLEEPAYDVVIPVSTPHPAAHSAGRARDMVKLVQETKKPLPHLWLAGDLGKEGLDILREKGVPHATNADSLLRAVGGIIRLGKIHKGEGQTEDVWPDPSVLERIGSLQEPEAYVELSEAESKALLREMGLPVLHGELVTDQAEAVNAGERIGYPVVLKVSSADIPHKTEAGGIRLDIRSAEEVPENWDQLLASIEMNAPDAEIEGIIVEEYAPGTEIILGILRDETFGPMVLVGTGGILAEAMEDAALGLAPISESEALRMIGSLRGRALLQGFRGAPPVDETALAKLLAHLSQIAAAYQEQVEEMDLNPVVFSDGQWRITDALLTLRPRE
jgi:acyl-CoA synthetase (NDP forming)